MHPNPSPHGFVIVVEYLESFVITQASSTNILITSSLIISIGTLVKTSGLPLDV